MKRFIAILMLVVGVVAAVLVPFAEMNRGRVPSGIDAALFFPARYPDGDWSPNELRFVDVYFAAPDGTGLHGWFCPAEDPELAILFMHGNAGNVTTRATLLRHLQSKAQASVFIFDYRGFGKSTGVPGIEGVIQDSRAARAKLCELASVENPEIVLMGESLGGAIAVQLAAESPPRALVLQSTFSSLRDLAEIHYRQYASMVPESTLNSVAQIDIYDGLLFQSHGDRDWTIPVALGQKLFAAARGKKIFAIIPGADHHNWLTPDYLSRLDGFLAGLQND